MNVLSWLWEPRLSLDPDSLTEKAFRRNETIKWAEVRSIRGVKLDKITYQENFLVIEDERGRSISIGELDTDFEAVEAAVREIFPGIPEHWRAPLEEGEDDILLWQRRM